MLYHRFVGSYLSPNAYIIAGPNGSGKTTFAREFLPKYEDCKSFINADLIAQGLSPFEPEAVAFRAGRLMLEEIELQAKRQESFGFETTLSGRTHLGVIRNLKERGYRVLIFYLWVPSVGLALSRIKARVLTGGHNVPEADVRRRFDRSIRNFFVHYRPLADSWTLYDNRVAIPRIIAFEEQGQVRVVEITLYNDLVRLFGTPR